MTVEQHRRWALILISLVGDRIARVGPPIQLPPTPA